MVKSVKSTFLTLSFLINMVFESSLIYFILDLIIIIDGRLNHHSKVHSIGIKFLAFTMFKPSILLLNPPIFDGFHIQSFAARYAPGALLTLGVLGLVAFLAAEHAGTRVPLREERADACWGSDGGWGWVQSYSGWW